MIRPKEYEDMITTDEAAEIIGCHPATLRLWCREGIKHPPYYMTGGEKQPKRYFRRNEVDKWTSEFRKSRRIGGKL